MSLLLFLYFSIVSRHITSQLWGTFVLYNACVAIMYAMGPLGENMNVENSMHEHGNCGLLCYDLLCFQIGL